MLERGAVSYGQTGANPLGPNGNRSTTEAPSRAEAEVSSASTREPASGTTTSVVPPAADDPSPPNESSAIPDYYLSGVSIDAEVVGERVEIEARVEVVVNRHTGWHRVPLRFDQAHIWSREYEGPGEEAPDFFSTGGEEGIHWMIKGLGKHQLRFSMWVPVRRSILGSHLQLSLPPLPPQFDTRLALRIPEPTAVLRSSPNLTVQSTSREAESTLFRGSVGRSRLDVVWTVPQSSSEVVSKVTTRFHLKPSPESSLLVADQTLELQQSDVREVVIRLPGDFELLNLSGARYQGHSEIPDREGWIRVQFAEGTTNRLDFRWLFRKSLPREGGRVVIDGMEVEGAVQEAGTIRIDELTNYRIIPTLAESKLTHRVSFSDVQLTGIETPNSMYEFLQQPFRLVHEIRPVEPLHSVTAIYDLEFGANRLALNVHQLIEVERGSLSSVRLQWPQFREAGWSYLGSEAASLTFGEIKATIDENTDEILLRLPNQLQRGQRAHVVSRFELPIMISEATDLHWTLPRVPVSAARGELLVVVTDDDIELEFDAETEKNFVRIAHADYFKQIIDIWNLPETFQELSRRALTRMVHSQASGDFQAKLTRHKQTVTSKTLLEILEATPTDLLVSQKLFLNVNHGRLNRIDLRIPQPLLDLIPSAAIGASLDVRHDRQPLVINQVGGVYSATFTKPIRGEDVIELLYRFPLSLNKENRSLSLPVISFEHIGIEQAECIIVPVENVRVDQQETGWVAVQTSPRGPHWMLQKPDAPLDFVPLLIGGILTDSLQQYIVEKASLWTRFGVDGRSETLARYELLAPPARLLISFPPGTEFRAITIDGEPLLDRADAAGKLVLQIPERNEARRLLEFHYRLGANRRFSLANQQTLLLPHFSESVWVNETVWEMQLPYGHHLFEYPELKPLFSWQRSGVIWERQPSEIYRGEREVVRSLLPEAFQFDENFYSFRGYAPVRQVTFRSMNRSLILLIGAGFALSLGFVFYRFPVTRNLFSLVVLAFIFAVSSLWYLEPMLLLLQPAIFGVLLALTATIIDVRTRRLRGESSSMRLDRGRRFEGQYLTDDELAAESTRIYSPKGSSMSKMSADQ